MARCARVREWLPEYDYGGPGVWQRWQVARHLGCCPECARELAGLRRATALLTALPTEPAPADMWASLERELARVERAPAPARPGRRVVPALAAAVAAALAVGLGVWYPRPEPAAPLPVASYVRSHLALSRAQPFAPGAGIDTLVVLTAVGEGR